MSVQLSQSIQNTIFVGGREETILENHFPGYPFAIAITFQQGSFTTPPTTGTLTFHVTFINFNCERKEKNICVTRLQFIQSLSIVFNEPIARVECFVRSNIETDNGIPVTATIQSLSIGKKERAKTEEKCQVKPKTKCKKCSSLSICPTLSAISPVNPVISTTFFTVTGTNLMILNCCPSG